MNWVLIVIIFSYGDTIAPTVLQQQFTARDLCTTAKAYYESPGFKDRILMHIDRPYLRLDAQCHQLDYAEKKSVQK
jgi:hypothetical protein